MKICKKCIQPNTRPGIFFDENGVCGACLWHQEKNKINWSAREEELHKIAKWAKENTKSCLKDIDIQQKSLFMPCGYIVGMH